METQDAASLPLRSFALHDVQGLWGGRSLWAAASRMAIVQVVRPGLWEMRYRVTLTDAQWAEAERLIASHHLFTLSLTTRPGVPDEAHPVIMAVAESGATARVGKWAGDRHPDFDPIYEYLRGLCRVEGEPIHEGQYEWDWSPDGFARP